MGPRERRPYLGVSVQDGLLQDVGAEAIEGEPGAARFAHLLEQGRAAVRMGADAQRRQACTRAPNGRVSCAPGREATERRHLVGIGRA